MLFGYRIYWQKALADWSYSMCFLARTTQRAVISEPYRHRRWKIDPLQQCGSNKKLVIPTEPCQTVEKAEPHPKKGMLCIWWYCRGPTYYELLPLNETINSEKYCAQLDILKATIGLANRRGVVFHQDNARPHVSVNTLQKLKGFGWDILNHHLILLIWHLQITICFGRWKTHFVERISAI